MREKGERVRREFTLRRQTHKENARQIVKPIS
jgi:hypothetical protein